MIYSVVIFRDNQIIHHERFGRDMKQSLEAFQHSEKLLLGMISAVRGIVGMLSADNPTNKFESLTTPEFRLDYYETLTGYSFVVLSQAGIPVNSSEIRSEFEKLYNLLFIPLVIRNPLFNPRNLSGDLRDSSCFAFLGELKNHFQSFSRSVPSKVTVPIMSSPQLLL